ncbi:hypothetical protein APHAL10511_006683 [Amanita phalloides]|nr:hypothetical protein APHAL10511_006683 [Amanita phalloides]
MLLPLLLNLISVVSAHSSINVSLRTSWPAPPFAAELLQAFSIDFPSRFFPVLNLFSNLNHPSPKLLRQSVVHAFLHDSADVQALDANLALHAAVPAVQALYAFYEDRHSDKALACSPDDQGQAWLDWYGHVVCSSQELVNLLHQDPRNNSRPQLLTFDHVHPPSSQSLVRPPHTAILYTSLDGIPWNFKDLHDALYSNDAVEYVLRYIPPRISQPMGCYLTAYGAALDFKKTDYLVLDDRATLHQGNKDTKQGSRDLDLDPLLDFIQSQSDETFDPNTPLGEEEIFQLGYQASQLIISTSSTSSTNNLTTPLSSLSPLDAFTTLCQNFPKYTQILSRRVSVSPEVEKELLQNALTAQIGANVVWVNGGIVFSPGPEVAGGGGTINGVDVLKMNRVLRRERHWIRTLEGLGMTRPEAVRVVSDSGGTVDEDGKPKKGQGSGKDHMLEGRVDASDRPEGGDIILWWNDIEKDDRYARWSPSFYTLMRPLYPGQFPQLKRNMFNIILILDLSTPSSLHLLTGTISTIIERGIPFRWGLVPSLASPDSRRMARAVYWLIHNAGRKRTMQWIRNVSGMDMPLEQHQPQLDWKKVEREFDNLMVEMEAAVKYDIVVNGEEDVLPKAIGTYAERLNIKTGSHAFFNGKHFTIDQDAQDFLGGIQIEVGHQMQYFQELAYQGALFESQEELDMNNWFYDQPGVSKRRNAYIVPSSPSGPGENNDGGGNPLRIVSLPEVFEKIGYEWKGSFVYPPGDGSTPLSMFVIADLDSDAGRTLVKEALASLGEEARMRATFVHNPTRNASSAATSRIWAHLVMTGQSSEESAEALGLGLDIHMAFEQADKKTYNEYSRVSQLFARELGFTPGEMGLAVNGRIIGPIEPGAFTAADFKMLEEYEYKKRAELAVETIERVCPWQVDLARAERADLVSLTASVLAAIQLPDPSDVGMYDVTPKPRGRAYLGLARNLTMFTHGDSATAMYHVVFVVNPLSETAQKWSGLIKWLTEMPDVYIEVHLNPNKQAEIPLKRFYRYSARSALTFDENGNEISAPITFEGLPVDPLYTLSMDVPSSWLVRPREALYDLDNIQLSHLSPSDSSVDAVFELDYLVIEGHARDTVTHSPPRGLQLQLVDTHDQPIADTLVVANLGYIQFRAKPGVFKLEIRQGRGREVYQIDSVGNEGWDSPSVDVGGAEITLTSFDGLTLYPRFSRRKGMETASVLEGDKGDTTISGVWDGVASRFKSLFKGGRKAGTGTDLTGHQAEINIFTVASGLLYERFVGIMILSVLRNTKSTVKFWFIENFLSPSFLEFIPHMANEYGFQYELITYKWPSWLRAQREKQRTIWAYKILFLDVLFPMDLKKVIFVDADQIVRADLKELVNLDLHGAPYAYTPMGDDNREMEGFRFWKRGYWAEALEGRPYHISALYLIDLVRFRQMAAGDILRGQYQQLSVDPNSLANLDQDLPNNLQRLVPIYSLHEDWLWCETWCSKDRLHRAKTIDLCQNPLTKEPKLARARQIPEWEEYDAEIARFTRKLAEEGKIRSGMATADVNSLANAGNTPAVLSSTAGEDTETEGRGEEAPGHDEL